MSLVNEWSHEELERKFYNCRIFPRLTPSPELSYILGVRYGDLSVDSRSVDLAVKDWDFAEEFKSCAEKVMRRQYRLGRRGGKVWVGVPRVIISSVILCEFLRLPLFEAHVYWIEPYYVAEFCRGMFDSEGSVHINNKNQPWLKIDNNDEELLCYVSALLEMHGISSHVIHPPSSAYSLTICGLSNVERFYLKIGCSIARKCLLLEYGLYEISHPRWRSEA